MLLATPTVLFGFLLPWTWGKIWCWTWLHGHRRAEQSYSTFKVRQGSSEEIPLVQGKEQWLRFAGAAVKWYPTSKVKLFAVMLPKSHLTPHSRISGSRWIPCMKYSFDIANFLEEIFSLSNCRLRAVAVTNVFSWKNSVTFCPASFCTPRPNLTVTPGISWLPPLYPYSLWW